MENETKKNSKEPTKKSLKKTSFLQNAKQKQICLNAFNDFYYNYFIELSNKARNQKQIKSQVFSLITIANSIKKYPYPIVSVDQATLIYGVGDFFLSRFKNIIQEYKNEIKNNNIDYISLACSIKPEIAEIKIKTKKSKKNLEKSKKNLLPGSKSSSQLKEIKADAKKIKIKNNLLNIKMYSSVWTTAICCYIIFIDKEKYDVEIKLVKEVANDLKDKLQKNKIKIEEPNINNNEENEKDDLIELKNLKLIDSIKKNKICINDYLIKFVKLELNKIGLSISKSILHGNIEYQKLDEGINFNSLNQGGYMNLLKKNKILNKEKKIYE